MTLKHVGYIGSTGNNVALAEIIRYDVLRCEPFTFLMFSASKPLTEDKEICKVQNATLTDYPSPAQGLYL
jgi:hypothetical protein